MNEKAALNNIGGNLGAQQYAAQATAQTSPSPYGGGGIGDCAGGTGGNGVSPICFLCGESKEHICDSVSAEDAAGRFDLGRRDMRGKIWELATARAAELREKSSVSNLFDPERVKYLFAAKEMEKLVEEMKAL